MAPAGGVNVGPGQGQDVGLWEWSRETRRWWPWGPDVTLSGKGQPLGGEALAWAGGRTRDMSKGTVFDGDAEAGLGSRAGTRK